MTQINQSFEDLSGTNWKKFKEAEFPIETTIDDRIRAWLVDTLRPLNLNARFLDKILTSAHLASERNTQMIDEQESDHVHVLIFTPVNGLFSEQSWGFFQVEKRGSSSAENITPDHAIAFYLYFEGK